MLINKKKLYQQKTKYSAPSPNKYRSKLNHVIIVLANFIVSNVGGSEYVVQTTGSRSACLGLFMDGLLNFDKSIARVCSLGEDQWPWRLA